MPTKLLTTSQAARSLAVTPDAVLKWVKAGKLRSLRTPGGHCRIPREEVERLKTGPQNLPGLDSTLYCWQFHAGSRCIGPDCKRCIVYRSQTGRCWELQALMVDIGHGRLHCSATCEGCRYHEYRLKKSSSNR